MPDDLHHGTARMRHDPGPRGVASEFIHHLPALVAASGLLLRVWLYVRKSNCVTGDNLAEQKARLIDDMIALGVHIVGITACVETGRIGGLRPGLDEALRQAQAAAAVLVAADRSRLLRGDGYNGTHATEMPRVSEYRMLEQFAGRHGVLLATSLHPDATPGQNRSDQTRRGMAAKGRPGGRPVAGRDAFRERWLPLALELHQSGQTLRQIADAITRQAGRKITHAGIRKWLRWAVNVYNFALDLQ